MNSYLERAANREMPELLTTDATNWLAEPTKAHNPHEYVRNSGAKKAACQSGGLSISRSKFAIRRDVVRNGCPEHIHILKRWKARTRSVEGVLHQTVRARPVKSQTTEEIFRELTEEWLKDIGSISSVSALIMHPKYRQIVALGKDVVPYLLADLKNRRGYWFAALDEITGIRPYDLRDAGNNRRMTDAWLKWGKLNQISF